MIKIDIYHHFPDGERDRKLDRIIAQQEQIMATIDDVLTEVTDESGRLDSIQAMIDGLKQQIADALSGVTLPPAVQQKLDSVFTVLGTNKGKLDKALNNGPSGPLPPPPVA